jgi:hypothetical protein
MSKSIRRSAALVLAGATAMLLLLPAAGQAATIFGSQLKNEPTEKSCEVVGTCTIVQRIVSAPPNGDPYSGGAPISGVITKFRTLAYAQEESGQITFRLANLTLPDPNNLESALGTAAGTGPTITLPAIGETEDPSITEVPARLPVRAGQQLAVDITPSIGIIYNSNGDKRSYLFAPPLVEGAGQRGSTEVVNELLVQATIEPDADNDGFGDETQDQCPTQAATHGPCDTTPPGITGLRVAKGKNISYTLSEAASVSFKLEKKSKGRKVGRKCVKQTKKNKAKKACPLFKQVASFGGPGNAGPNSAAIPRKLGPGSYRLTMTARDALGNTSTKTTTFKIAAKKKKKK